MVELTMKKRLVLKILGVYFILHSFRNLMQYFRVENFLTTTGHEFGVWYTNRLLSLMGLSYTSNMEIWFFLGEFILGVWILKLVKLKSETK